MTELSASQIAAVITGHLCDPVAELRLLILFRSEPPDRGEVQSAPMRQPEAIAA